MGWWGYGSDENDDTYNSLGCGIADRIHGVNLNQDLEALQEASKLFNDEVIPKAGWKMGVIIWGLRQGLMIDKAHLQSIRKTMEAEQRDCSNRAASLPVGDPEAGSGGWPLQREAALAQELKEIDSALLNGRSIIARKSKTLLDRFAETPKKG